MSEPTLPPSLDPPRPCEREARAQRQMRMLEELAEIGMKLARAVERRIEERLSADAEDGDAGLADAGLALVFSRISRAVRQTIALESRLDRELHDARLAEHAVIAGQARDATRTLARRRKHAVREAVQAAFEADGPELEALLADLDERLEDSDDDLDFAELPIADLAARLCRQLGVPFDPSLWEDEAPGEDTPTALDPQSFPVILGPRAEDPDTQALRRDARAPP